MINEEPPWPTSSPPPGPPEPGKEDVVRDAIEKLTPPSREEPGNVFYQAYQDPAEPAVFRLFEIYDDEDAYAAHGASEHFKEYGLEPGHPGAGQPRARVLRDDRLTHAPRRLPRPTDEPRRAVRRPRAGPGSTCGCTRSTPRPTSSSCSPRRRSAARRWPTWPPRQDGLSLDEVVLLPPVYPVAMRDFLTFEAHVDGMERGHGARARRPSGTDAPVFLFMAPHAVTGPYDDVAMPPDTERLDFELEIAAIVCRDVRNVTAGAAREAIGGYCVMNDWSARDIQGREMKLELGPSKGKDFATTIGPWVVTADELDGHRDADGFLDLEMTVSVNGEQVGGGPLRPHGLVVRADGVLRLPRVVGEGRRGARLRHLRVRLAGRVVGPDRLADPPPLQVGDVVEMTIERHRHDPEPGRRVHRGPRPRSRPPVAGTEESCPRCPPSRPSTRPRAALATYDAHDEAAVEAALAGAHAAYDGVVARPLAERTDLLRAVGKLLTERREEYAALITAEMGKPLAEALAEVDKCAWNCEVVADSAPELAGRPRGRVRRGPGPGCRTSRWVSCSR